MTVNYNSLNLFNQNFQEKKPKRIRMQLKNHSKPKNLNILKTKISLLLKYFVNRVKSKSLKFLIFFHYY